jgi:DDE family transposase
MAFDFQKSYRPEIAPLVRQYSQSLSAKDRRRFAALEAIQRGHGGIRYMSQVLGCDPQTIKDGMQALQPLPEDPAGSRVRQPGGGRTKTEVKQADLLHQVHDTIQDRTAGDPMREDVVWTDVPPQELAARLPAQGVWAGPRIVRRMLATLGLARRQRAQGLAGGAAPHRDAPLRPLAPRMQELLEAGHPVLSIDTTQTACLGTLSRDGTGDCQQALQAFAHAFPPWPVA